MVKRKGGTYRKARHMLRKTNRKKGKISLRNYFTRYSPGDAVCLVAESGVQKGKYHRRFHGKAGTVKARRGFCYEVEIKDQNKQKMLILHPVHLRKR